MSVGRWAVFISGTGSNLQTLLDACSENLPVKIYSSKARAPGISKSKRMGVPVQILPSQIDWDFLHQDLLKNRVQKIFLLGFMKILPESFVSLWQNKMINLHPSLLPSYPGLKSFERAWVDQAPLGASVHIVTAEMDAGKVLKQKAFSRTESQDWDRLKLSWSEQRLVREAYEYVAI